MQLILWLQVVLVYELDAAGVLVAQKALPWCILKRLHEVHAIYLAAVSCEQVGKVLAGAYEQRIGVDD